MKKKYQQGLEKIILTVQKDLLKELATDYDLDLNELEEKYLPKKEVKQKRKRINGYTLFLGDVEVDKKIREENPDIDFGEIAKIKGKMWRNMPSNEKKVWSDLAEEYKKSTINEEQLLTYE